MENIGAEKTKIEIILDKDWQQSNVQYVMGFDPYEQEHVPINFYHRIRKYFKLPFKEIENNSVGVIYKIKDGIAYDMISEEFKDREILKPIGDFIIENATGVQGVDGVYYHYTEVIKLLKLYEK